MRFPAGLSIPEPDLSKYPERPLWRDLGGEVHDLPHVDPDPLWRTMNPSVAIAPDGELAVALRTGNFYLDPSTGEYFAPTGDIRNRTFVARLTPDLRLDGPARLVDWGTEGPSVRRGHEDCRLFQRGGEWRLLGAMKEPDHTPEYRQVEYAVDLDTGDATWLATHQPPLEADPARPQKNWMCPSEPTDDFDFVYSAHGALRRGEFLLLREDFPPEVTVRGGSLLSRLDDGSYLALVHSIRVMRFPFGLSRLSHRTIWPVLRDYPHYLARYDASGRLVELSSEFNFLTGGVEFGAGLAVRGDELVLSFGSWDVSAHLATVPLEAALDWLRPI